jgi:hypothetical protein
MSKGEKLALAADLSLPIEAVTETFAALGRRGSGKSYAAQKLAELMWSVGAQFVVLDPVGNWHGLRIAGEGAGIPVPVFGGLHGDLPLQPAAGAFIARLIVERGISVVLDVSQFRKGDRKHFVTDFAEEFFHLKKAAPSAVHLFIEEAHVFVPQRPQKGEERMLGAIEDPVRLGRNYGIGVTLISQRAASVNKNVLTQVEVLLAFQTVSAQDRAAVEAWIAEKEIDDRRGLAELPRLDSGEAFLYSPGWLRTFRRIKVGKKQTADASATPKVGAKAPANRPLAAVDLDAIRGAMAEVVKAAEAADPTKLRAELRRALAEKADLALQLEQERARKSAPAESKLKPQPWISEATLRRVEKSVERTEKVLEETRSGAQALRLALDAAVRSAKAPLAVRPPTNGKAHAEHRAAITSYYRSPSGPLPKEMLRGLAPARTGLLRGERAILQALAARHPTSLTRQQVATLAGYAPGGGGFNNYLGKLRAEHLIERDGERLQVTPAGVEAAGAVEQPSTPDELVDLWCSKLTGKGKDMLRALVRQEMTRDELAQHVEMEAGGGGFNNYLGALRSNGLIEKNGDRFVAVEELRP